MWARLLPPARDAALAGVLLAVGEAELRFGYATASGPTTRHALAMLLTIAPLAWRRVVPLVAGTLVLAAFALGPVLAPDLNTFAAAVAVTVAVFSLAAHAASWEAAVAGGVVAVGLVVAWSALDPAPENEWLADSVFVALAWSCGAVVRRHRLAAGSARADADAARSAAGERAAALLRDERARIARELHDVVAHGIAVTVLQARGGRRVLAEDPAAAAAALDDIERVSAQSLAEMRRLVGMLREDGGDDPSTGGVPEPQPGLRDLDRLVRQVRAAGLETEVAVDGEPRELPPGLDLSAYRIVQEALTNVLRHSPGARARLCVRWEPAAVALQVTDDGPATAAAPAGHGLTGMRERVALFGGTLECGPRPEGGHAVVARLPVPG